MRLYLASLTFQSSLFLAVVGWNSLVVLLNSLLRGDPLLLQKTTIQWQIQTGNRITETTSKIQLPYI